MRRLGAAIMLAGALVVGLVFVRSQDDGCPDPWVMYDYACTIPNELIVMTNGGQDRQVVETAISSPGGQIVFTVEEAGVYAVRYAVQSPGELAPLKAVLEAAGFTVAHSYMGELFADR